MGDIIIACLICIAVTAGIGFLMIRKVREKQDAKIRELSSQLEALLHDGTKLPIRQYEEGEWSILADQIQKTVQKMENALERSTADRVFLSDSLADISHQLRTPLMTMNLTVSMLEDETLPEEKRQELVRDLEQLLSHIEWLIGSLLQLSKMDAGTVRFAKQTLLLNDIVRKAAGPLAIPMELRDQELKIDCGSASFIGDPTWTAEAVANILKNCMEHTPEGGVIRVLGEENALYTKLEIRDSGPGFAEDDLPHLFERFYKGKDAAESNVGIGLALARKIIVSQGGTIRASNSKEGACFEIRFYKQNI
ncbi:MAG: HAMP domain-containing histidine kinase [Lachnospiraceae bacterium]|nr:HAMP domain-containing histidine kinase [Lachnospiraceae bacterium]